MLGCSVLSLFHFLKMQRQIITSFLISINGLLSYCLGLISNGNNVQFCFFLARLSPICDEGLVVQSISEVFSLGLAGYLSHTAIINPGLSSVTH